MSAHASRFPRLIATCATLATLAFSGTALAAEPGVNSDVTWGLSQGDIDRSVTMMDQQGVRWARVGVSWKSVEPNSKGSYSSGYLSGIDSTIAKLTSAGIEVEMLIDTVPYWASADPSKHIDSSGTKVWDSRYRPSSYQDYADVVGYLAQRYSPKGVDVFEVWNEPNLSYFWPSGPNPAEYTKMLQAAYPAIKGAAPDATVIAGALSQNDHAFLKGMYAAGARPYFDAIATHSYPTGDPNSCWNDSSGHRSREAFCSIEEIRQVMEANGDAAKSIWLDEFGWSTCDNAHGCYGKGVTEGTQAEYITAAFHKLEGYGYVKAALVYNFRNTYFRNEAPGDFNAHLGLARMDFSPKPAYHAFAEYALGLPSGAPRVELLAPSKGDQFDSKLALAADAADDKGVSKVEFWVDETKVGTDTSAPYAYTWRVPKKLSYGAHTVEVRAFDGDGRTATDGATVTRKRGITLAVAPAGKVAAESGYRARGTVAGAKRGRVSIRIQRKSASGWTTAGKRQAKLTRRGRYSAGLGPMRGSGRWRVQAIYRSGGAPARSDYRYVRGA